MGARHALFLAAASVAFAACDSDASSIASTSSTAPTTSSSSTTSTTTTTTTIAATTTTTGSTTSTTSAPTTTTTTSTPTTTPTTTTVAPTTTVVPSTCPSGPDLPAGADALTGIAVDLNVDGLPDTLQTYVIPATLEWHVRVTWGGGGSSDEVVEGVGGTGASQPIGEFDVESDGTPEIFLTVGSGAATLLVGLYDVAGCDLARVTVDGAPASFPVGATAGNVSGLSCDGVGDLDRVFASFVADDEWEGGFEPFSLAGSVLTGGIGDGATFTAAEAGALAALDCGSLAL